MTFVDKIYQKSDVNDRKKLWYNSTRVTNGTRLLNPILEKRMTKI